MKKTFPIIGHVFLGVILLVFFCVVSLMFIDSQQEHYLWISLALSILLSIIIPIRRYKKAIKNKKPVGLTFGNILVFLLWWGVFAVIPLAVFIKFLPLIEATYGLPVVILMCILVIGVGYAVYKDPKAIEKYNKAKKKNTLL